MLKLSSGSCMLRLKLRLSFRGRSGQPLPLSLSLGPSLRMHDPMLSVSLT